MAALKDLLYKVSLMSTSGDMDRKVSHVTFDSRDVTEGSLFIAISTQVAQVSLHVPVLLIIHQYINIHPPPYWAA